MEHSLVGALSHRRHTDHVVAGELATYQKVNLVRRKRKGFPAMSASDSLVSLQHGLVVPLEAWLLAIRCEEVGIKLVPRGDTLDADGPLNPELVAALRRLKPHVLAILRYTPDNRHLFDPSVPFPEHGPLLSRSA